MIAMPRPLAMPVSRVRNFPVGMPATVRRNRFPRCPRPRVSRPVERASAKSKFSTTIAGQFCWWAKSSRLLMAARTRPSRRDARSPAVSTAMLMGSPIGLPDESSTQAATWSALRSTPSTGPALKSSRSGTGPGESVQDASKYQRPRLGS